MNRRARIAVVVLSACVLVGAVVVAVGASAPRPGVDPAAAPGAAGGPTGTSEPVARICGDAGILGGGPVDPPAGAVVVPAGDNESLDFAFREPDTTFWFAPGVHTLGAGEYSQIIAGSRSTYVGAPGAIIDGAGINNYAFTGDATGVTIRYLTVRNFNAPVNEGTINQGFGSGWLVEFSTVTENAGAGLMSGGADNTYRSNCIADNGQYGVNACCGTAERPSRNLRLEGNEITGNNTGDWESRIEGCGCTGGVKFWINSDITITDNWVHDNRGTGLWLDNNNSGALIEGNTIEDNDGHAIHVEAGYDTVIRGNAIRRNALVTGRAFQARDDQFPIGAIYVSENGSPDGYGLRYVPSEISGNLFEDNWGGVVLWESADRYCGSSGHTHPPFCTVKVDLYDDAQCSTDVADVIPAGIGDKYRCRWSTENVVVHDNDFVLSEDDVGGDCVAGGFCGVSGLFGGVGTLPGFPGYEIPWRTTFAQGNVFRDNRYVGPWQFAAFLPTRTDKTRVTWDQWRAPAPAVPAQTTNENQPVTFGQDAGSTYRPAEPR